MLPRLAAAQCSSDFLFKFGTFGGGNGQFANPFGLAVNSAGNIFVADFGNSRIQVFDSTDNFLFKFGSFPGWLSGTCQARATIGTTIPHVPNGLGNLIQTGQAGSLKFNVGGAVGLIMTPRTAT